MYNSLLGLLTQKTKKKVIHNKYERKINLPNSKFYFSNIKFAIHITKKLSYNYLKQMELVQPVYVGTVSNHGFHGV